MAGAIASAGMASDEMPASASPLNGMSILRSPSVPQM
jgi:hypothetical protein